MGLLPPSYPVDNSGWIPLGSIRCHRWFLSLCSKKGRLLHALYTTVLLISLLQLSWKGTGLSHLWWGLTEVYPSPCPKQNLTTNVLTLQHECLSALPKHIPAVLMSCQTWSCPCKVWGQLWVPPALSCSILALLVFYPDRMSHFVLFFSRRREQQWAQNIIPHWREWSGKEVLHP